MPPDGLGLGLREPLGLNCFDLIHDASRGAGPCTGAIAIAHFGVPTILCHSRPGEPSQPGSHISLSLPVIMLACVPWNPLSPSILVTYVISIFFMITWCL